MTARGTTQPKRGPLDLTIFMDSGAFGNFTGKALVSLDAYCEWLELHAGEVEHYSNLDVIGDEAATYARQKEMERRGFSPVPVAHLGAEGSIDLVHRYISEGYQYIAFGGIAGTPKATRVPLLDAAFRHVPKDVKIHGFGVGDFDLIPMYPWHSVDSSSIIQACGVAGTIYVPQMRGGEFDFRLPPINLSVASNKMVQLSLGTLSSSKWTPVPSVWDTLDPRTQEHIRAYFELVGRVGIGRAEYRIVDDTYQPKDGERLLNKKGRAAGQPLLAERVVEVGVTNDYVSRYREALYFVDRFSEQHGVQVYLAGAMGGLGTSPLLSADVSPRNLMLTFADITGPHDNSVQELRATIKRHLRRYP